MSVNILLLISSYTRHILYTSGFLKFLFEKKAENEFKAISSKVQRLANSKMQTQKNVPFRNEHEKAPAAPPAARYMTS